MDWALVTWGILISIVALLWIMVMASVQDHVSDGEDDAVDLNQKPTTTQQNFERQTAA